MTRTKHPNYRVGHRVRVTYQSVRQSAGEQVIEGEITSARRGRSNRWDDGPKYDIVTDDGDRRRVYPGDRVETLAGPNEQKIGRRPKVELADDEEVNITFYGHFHQRFMVGREEWESMGTQERYELLCDNIGAGNVELHKDVSSVDLAGTGLDPAIAHTDATE